MAEIPTFVSPKAMTRALGATVGEADGVLEPRRRDMTLKARWQIADGLPLVPELDQRAIAMGGDASRWERLQRARARTRLTLDRLIDAIRGGLLELGRLDGDAADGRA